jgi:hypothetical protein
MSISLTKQYRPDLFANYTFTKEDKKLLDELKTDATPKWEQDAIEKGKKFTKNH